ncbi:MAG TPA: DUF397 domain-containing protein [Streptosporangiaceae bacterium]|nr:DUF397 domain-containing protein [Streptosporangiaceae bacterium]
MTGGKPTVESLDIDVSAAHWQRSGTGDGAIEIALVGPAGEADADQGDAEWVLMRISGDADGRVLVYDRYEWECFLDGVRAGEFDAAAS